MTFVCKNILPAVVVPLMLFISITELSCVGNEQPGNSPVRAAIQTKQWYRQALVDLGAKIRMYSENDGVAISRGMGKDVRGKAYRFTNGQWVPFVEFPYSDYPLIGRFDSTNVWTITHLTHEYAYRPVHTIFTNSIRKEIPLPKIMWDEVDYVMFKGLHQLSDGTAWMVGQQGHILYYNGVRWEEKKSPLINPDRSSSYDGDLNDITMTTHQSGWAVGRNGVILRYENSQWNIVPSPVNQTLQKISMVNDSTGWAVGNSGTILQCRKFVWTKVFIDMHEQLFSIVAFDERNAWIVGNNSTLLSYDGTSWSTDESIKNYNDLFADLSVVRDSSGQLQFWIIGNEGIYTTHQSLGVSFTDVTDQVGLRRVGKLGHFLERSDADLPDLLVANDGGSSLLYENTGEGLYADVTGTTELLTSPKAALIMAVGDVNNDGEQDVLEVADQRNFGLYLGTSAGGFRDFTDRSALSFDEINPMAPAAAKFVELNNDGNLDLYISNYDMPDQIFLGDGTGRFFRFREKSGIEKILNHASYGAAFGDFNNDGLTDIFIPYYVSNNKKFFSMFQNTGGMKFEEVDDPNFYSSTDLSPTAIAVSDVNNDGFADVYIHSQKVAPLLWLNDGTGKFTDVSRQYGFTQFAGQLEPINGIVGSADVNNDGQIDIFAGSHLYLNSQRGQFSEVSERVGIQFVGTPIFSDVDNDGDQDMFIGSSRTSLGKGDRAALYRNNLNNNNFVKVRVRGDVSNRSAIGARVVLTQYSGEKQTRTIGGGGSQLSTQNINEVHFGVVAAEDYLIEVFFPSGVTRRVEKIRSGSIVEVYESNALTRLGILMIKSVNRMVDLMTPYDILQKLFALVLVVAVFIGIGYHIDAQRIVKQRPVIPLVCLLFVVFTHFLMYEREVVSTLIATAGTSLISISSLFVARSVIQKREAKYIGHFKIMELLGAGGMGKVYKAIDTTSKRIVALKILNPELLKDPENRRRLSAEGHVLASFDHPNIVKVFEIGESSGQGFIAMEYLHGGTLRDRLEHEHPLSLEVITSYLLQICDGLTEVHDKGIIHRDLKTGNVMLDGEGKARIMDFGLSKSPLVTTMTTLGTVLGTLGYVAPEQVTGLNVDRRTDIFSFGVMMYELVTKELPFKGENEIALIHSIFNTVPPAPSQRRTELPKLWDEIVMKCLAKDPNNRYNKMEEVKQILLHPTVL